MIIDGYEDIINLSHHVSSRHLPMSREERAAQFAPFAALTGYSDAVKETDRLTEVKIELTEEEKKNINKKLIFIYDNLKYKYNIGFTYFVHDMKKEGGKYIDVVGVVKKIDKIEKYLLLTNNIKIFIDDLIDIKIDNIKIEKNDDKI